MSERPVWLPRLSAPLATEADARALKAATPWIVAALALALGPALFVLPAWVSALTGLILLLKLVSWKTGWRPPLWTWLPLIGVAIGGVAVGFEDHFAGPAAIAYFALVLALKWLETHTRRDAALMLLAGAVLAALGAVHHVAALSMLLLIAFAVVLAGGLLALNGARRPGREALAMLLAALPMAVLLFVLTPRVPGPLWDLGLAVGLPIMAEVERAGPGLGGRDSLKPGAGQGGGLENGTVLVAEFENWVPPASRLYWRGPVFTRFDGESWQPPAWWENRSTRMAAGFRRSAGYKEAVKGSGEPVRYSVRLAAHGGPWLYALDMPAGLPAESYLTADFQLLSMTPVVAETRYKLGSWLDWRAIRPPLAEERAELLALPEGANPRLTAQGRALRAARGEDAAAMVANALSAFVEGQFRLNPKAQGPAGRDAYDRFFFQSKEGGPEYFAASYVLMMRAAGVPARLVTGYRGGRLMALTDYVLVKQSNAHAWAEVWTGQTWQRVDVADAVAPLKEKAASLANKPQTQTAPQTRNATAPRDAPPPHGEERPSWLALLDGLDHWVIHYDAQRQSELLGGGDQDGRWQTLGFYLLGGLGLLVGLAWLYRRLAESRHADPLAGAWHDFHVRLAKAGQPSASTVCPVNLARRLALLPASWGEAAAGLAADYARLRYARSPGIDAKHLARRLAAFDPSAYQEVK
jgi:transglutaminase-like putative cysteine protease